MDTIKQYRQWAIWTIAAVYFLILIGGVVRATGSGMGCPDWPKCFGQWIPPTSLQELPPNYKAIYLEKRMQKNQRLAKMLKAIGLSEAADKILNDPAVRTESDFNVVKTWIEYVNRLLGVLIGIFIILTCWYAFRIRQMKPLIFILSIVGLLLVLFQGWLGSIVVAANLLPFIVTVHMLLAISLVAVLIYALALAQTAYKGLGIDITAVDYAKLQGMMVLVLLVYLVAMVLGTQVREKVDLVMMSSGKDGIIDKLGLPFIIHRSWSYLVIIVLYFQSRWISKISVADSLVGRLIRYQQICVGLSLVTGVTMAYLNLPAIAQPIHLLLGSALIGLQLVVVLLLRFEQVSSLKSVIVTK